MLHRLRLIALLLPSALLCACVTPAPPTSITLVDDFFEDRGTRSQYLCYCFETGQQVCSNLPTMPDCPSQYSCSPVDDCGGGGNPFPKLLSHAIVRKLEGDGCQSEMYDFTSRAFYFHPGKTMADFEFGFSDGSLTDGCSLSIALLRTEKADWFNRNFWDVTMEWYPGNVKSADVCTGARTQQLPVNTVAPEQTTIDPATLTYSDPITIAPGGDGAKCVLEFHRPAEEPPCDPLPWCNPHGYLSKLSFDVMFLGPGKHQCDIEWFIDVDPTERKYRSVPERPRAIKFTFKQATPTATCSLSLISNFFNIPKFGRGSMLGPSSIPPRADNPDKVFEYTTR